MKHNPSIILPCFILLLSGCSAPVPLPPATDIARFEATDCWVAVPQGIQATCGYVRVPEDRSEPQTPENEIRLAVLITHAHDSSPASDPVFFLSGGPGERAIAPVNPQEFQARWDFILKRRDMVFVDQRGTGFSEPSLNCPEAYSSAASAADVNDVRMALGYEQINLLGGSYGTRLGLTLPRDYPEGIRSAVLDAVSPPQIHLDTAMLVNFDRALNVLFDDCAASPDCIAAYPDLEQTLYSLAGQLDTNPLTIHVPVGQTMYITTGRFLGHLWEAMNHTEALPYLPLLIHSTYHRDPQGYTALASLSQDTPGAEIDFMSEGLLWSVHCAEEWAYESDDEWMEAAQALDPAIREPVKANFLGFNVPCQVWNMPPAPMSEEATVYSDVPTLLLSGEYDPATSPEWAELAAKTLSHAYAYILPGTGHVTFRTRTCAQSLIIAFLDDPLAVPDRSCVTGMEPPVFVTDP